MKLLTASLAERGGPHQRLSRVGPAVGVSVLAVVILQKGEQALLEIGRGVEISTLEEPARHDAEPKFHLVQPRAMDRGKVKHMAVRRIGQKRTALRPVSSALWSKRTAHNLATTRQRSRLQCVFRLSTTQSK